MGLKIVRLPDFTIVINVYGINPNNGALVVVERRATDKRFFYLSEAHTYARAFNNNQKDHEGQVEKRTGVYPERMSRAIVEEI